MGLFDSVVGALGAAAGGGAQPDLMKLVGSLMGPERGGLAGLIQEFQQGGLGDVVASWVGTGANLPISAEQISQVLGPDTLQKLAQQLGGAGGGDLAAQLSQMLPQVVDKLTPNGQLPTGGDLPDLGALGDLGGLLGGFLKR